MHGITLAGNSSTGRLQAIVVGCVLRRSLGKRRVRVAAPEICPWGAFGAFALALGSDAKGLLQRLQLLTASSEELPSGEARANAEGGCKDCGEDLPVA